MINLSIWLYGKPNWDLDIEGKKYLNPRVFVEHGKNMKEHLYWVADVLEKLQCFGWALSESYGSLYSLEFYKEEITKEEAVKELMDLGIDPELVCVEELEEEFE